MAQVRPPSTTLSHLRGDADGHYRILVLGKTSSEKKKTVKRLSRALSLEVFSLEGGAQKSAQSSNLPDYGASWLIHAMIMGETMKRALDEATHIIWLDAPFISTAGRLRRLFLTEMARSSSKLGAPSATAVFASGWEEHWHERDLIKAVYQTDDRQDRWRHFAGWRGRIELRRWLKQFDSETRAQPHRTWVPVPFYQVPDDYHYYLPSLMIF